MEDVFKPSSLTIKQLFGNTDALYQIPRYQRPYSWSNEQLEKLWDDLVEAKENEPNYFLGSVITAKPVEQGNYMDIVDGQQRLTTLMILFCVFRDLYPSINSHLLDSDPFAVDSQIIKASIAFNDRFERLRLKTHSNHQSEFERIILKGNTLECEYPYKKELRIEEEPKYKFNNSAAFFVEKLRELGEEESGLLLNYIFNQVKIIRIDCQSVSFAIKLFQVLNDRGLDLSNSDLIKSFLIGKIHKLYSSNEEMRKQKEEQFMDDWKRCEQLAIDSEESINDLFVIYEYYLLGQNPKFSLYDELVKLFETKDANNVISDFLKFCEYYKNEIYHKKDKHIYALWYIKWSVYWRSILLTALHTKYPFYKQLLHELTRFYYLNWIAGNTLSKIKQSSFNLIRYIKEGKSIPEIKTELEKHLNQYQVIQYAIDNLNGDIYFERWCKPLLCMVEYKQLDESSVSFLNINDRNLHVEHIFPQNYKKIDDWKEKSNPEIDASINSGGNLTLLSGEKNISASNNPFSNKISAYNGKGLYGKDENGITSFRITQYIVDDYNSGKYNKQWNTESIRARKKWFLGEVERLLEIKIPVIE